MTLDFHIFHVSWNILQVCFYRQLSMGNTCTLYSKFLHALLKGKACRSEEESNSLHYHCFYPKNLQGKTIQRKLLAYKTKQNKTVNMKDEWHFSKETLLFSSAVCPFNIVHWSSLKINGVPITCHCCFIYHNLYMAVWGPCSHDFFSLPRGNISGTSYF